jgi:hypothetical protein
MKILRRYSKTREQLKREYTLLLNTGAKLAIRPSGHGFMILTYSDKDSNINKILQG